MKRREYKERRLYYSETCAKCGKPFKSFKRSRIKGGVCKRYSCRYSVPDNQTPLFPAIISKNYEPNTKIELGDGNL